MKRALSVFYSFIILVFFLPDPAGANLIRSGGSGAGDPAGWNTGKRGTNDTSLVEPSTCVAFFGGEDSASASGCDGLFISPCTAEGVSDPYLNPDRMVWGVSGRALSYKILQDHAYFSVSAFWVKDPDARMRFQLLEAYGLFCDNTDTWAFLNTIPVEEIPAPVPEPATILLIGSGLVSVGLISRWRRKTKS